MEKHNLFPLEYQFIVAQSKNFKWDTKFSGIGNGEMRYFTPQMCVLSRKGVLYPEMAYYIPKWSTTSNPVLN